MSTDLLTYVRFTPDGRKAAVYDVIRSAYIEMRQKKVSLQDARKTFAYLRKINRKFANMKFETRRFRAANETPVAGPDILIQIIFALKKLSGTIRRKFAKAIRLRFAGSSSTATATIRRHQNPECEVEIISPQTEKHFPVELRADLDAFIENSFRSLAQSVENQQRQDQQNTTHRPAKQPNFWRGFAKRQHELIVMQQNHLKTMEENYQEMQKIQNSQIHDLFTFIESTIGCK